MSGGNGAAAALVARSFAALGLGEAVSRLIAFVATVYAARVLGPGVYGVVGVAAAVVLYLNRVADAGFELGLGVRELAADPGFLQSAVPSVLTFRTLVAALLAALAAAIGLLLLPAPDGAVLAVQGLTLLAVGIGCRWVHLGFQRSRVAAGAFALGQVVMVALVLGLVRGPGDVATVAGAQVVGDLTAALVLLAALRRYAGPLPVRLDRSVLRPLLPRAGHLVASALLGIVIYNADFLFLRVLRGASAVGYYAAAYTLVTFFLNVGAMYNLSLLPSLTRLRGEAAGRALYHTALAQVFAVGFPVALGGTLLARGLVGLLYGAGYTASTIPFALLVWCIPLNLLRDVPLMTLVASGEERAVFRVTAVAAGLNLLLNLLLIPPFGLLGAAAATIVTETVRMAAALGRAQAHGFSLPGLGRFGRAALAGAAMVVALVMVAPRSLWAAVPLGLAAYILALAASGGLRLRRGAWPALSV